ncbi:hypothetical protein EDC48_11183 [Gibbsiella quercinecans]|nr:hypothetical protein [Gibbsiella quercinecans]TCT87715.1 hypothetical protein EDC48_11183 [Gibbsiella quercinecans]
MLIKALCEEALRQDCAHLMLNTALSNKVWLMDSFVAIRHGYS